MTAYQVTTTVDSPEAAEMLARGAVEARLAACAQIAGPITSVYRWQGTIETAQEWTVTFKTTADRYPELASQLAQRHPYELPEILRTDSAGSEAYLDWLRAETAQPAG